MNARSDTSTRIILFLSVVATFSVDELAFWVEISVELPVAWSDFSQVKLEAALRAAPSGPTHPPSLAACSSSVHSSHVPSSSSSSSLVCLFQFLIYPLPCLRLARPRSVLIPFFGLLVPGSILILGLYVFSFSSVLGFVLGSPILSAAGGSALGTVPYSVDVLAKV